MFLFHKYRVLLHGAETAIQKARWWQPGRQDFDLAKANALRYMRYQKEALEDAISHVEEMYPCVPDDDRRCGIVTHLRRDGIPACPKHGGR